MQLNKEKAKVVFLKVRQVREELKAYCIGHDRPDLGISDLQSVIKRMYHVDTTLQVVPFEGEFLCGLIERSVDGSAVISIKQDTDEQMRFVAIKEMCHIVIDEEEDWSPRAVENISTLLVEYAINDSLATKVSQSEMLAEMAAIELAYPYADRTGDRESIRAGALTPVKIASRHKIPTLYVIKALTDWYYALSSELWGELDEDLRGGG